MGAAIIIILILQKKKKKAASSLVTVVPVTSDAGAGLRPAGSGVQALREQVSGIPDGGLCTRTC